MWLGVARCAILTIPFRWTTRLFTLKPGGLAAAGVDPPSSALAHRIGWALRSAAARSPWQSTCLAQALAGTVMLRCRRIPSSLTMGVAKSGVAPGSLAAHAWLKCGGNILTGRDGHEKYSIVAEFTVSRLRHG